MTTEPVDHADKHRTEIGDDRQQCRAQGVGGQITCQLGRPLARAVRI